MGLPWPKTRYCGSSQSDWKFLPIEPEGAQSQPLDSLLTDLSRWLKLELNLPAKASVALDAVKRELERQIASIEAGEQAANAKLQAAIDTLQPAVDYHEYSRGGTA